MFTVTVLVSAVTKMFKEAEQHISKLDDFVKIKYLLIRVKLKTENTFTL